MKNPNRKWRCDRIKADSRFGIDGYKITLEYDDMVFDVIIDDHILARSVSVESMMTYKIHELNRVLYDCVFPLGGN